jgi:outer membrane lipoprotein SlyB
MNNEQLSVSKVTSHPLLIIAAVAVIIFCAAGVAAIMGWIPKSDADADVPPQAATKSAPTSAAASAKPRPLQTAAAQPKAAQSKAVRCAECGVVESIREIEKQGDVGPIGVGSVAGGVIGGVVGHQIGSGRGNDVATVVGAVGGAVAGHAIEKNMKKTKIYQITIRFEDGTSRTLSQSALPSWRPGDRVKVVGNEIQSNA